MRLALLQINPTAGDLDGNAALIMRSARAGHALGADLMVTPELALMGEAGGVGAVAEDAGLDQGVAAVAAYAPAPGHHQSECCDAAGDHEIRPGWPAGFAPLDQRVDEQAHPHGGECGAGEVEG